MAEPMSNTSETKQLKQAAVALTNHACTLSMQHIQDGMLRLQFNREVAYYAQGIVRDVEGGRKSVAQGVEALWGEHADLREKSWFYFKNGLGMAAGALQITGGVGICYGSLGLACIPGAGIALHGANNVYENANNLVNKRSDTEGFLRQAYQKAFRSKSGGNIAYGLMDIWGSGYGAYRLAISKNSWKLFRNIDSDYIRAYKETAPWILTTDGLSTGITTYGVADELLRDEK